MSDTYDNPRPKRPERRSRPSRGPAGSLQELEEEEEEDNWRVGTTENRAAHLPQPPYVGRREPDESYAGGRFNYPDPVYRDTPPRPRPLGEMAPYYNYRDFNPFAVKDEYTAPPYFGGVPPYGPPTYPDQGFNYAQPVNYPQASHYPPPHYPPNYGYHPPQPFPSFNPPQPPPADRLPVPPVPPVRNSTHPGKDEINTELKKVMKELEENKRKVADKEDLIHTFRSKDRESEILYKAKKTEARAQKKEEQAKAELEAAAQKRLEDEKQELARREYQEKLNRAVIEAREQLEERLREEERIRKSEEQRLLGLEADLRRRIEAEMAEEQERRKREAEKRLYLGKRNTGADNGGEEGAGGDDDEGRAPETAHREAAGARV
ncbi:hypothetical protein PG994_004200 [Apiospora phragmitis]|uniref:Uncharacterized protein n=1 Tax=Apiospora phragmitis TaxID=2905665 RepID=A0ABR1VPX4_9PEZI